MKPHKITKPNLITCSKLYTHVFFSDFWNEAWTEKVAYERLLYFYESKGFVGVLAKETETKSVLGFALGNIEPFYKGKLFYLREMCTQTQSQNQGIGKVVLQALETQLQMHNVKSIYLTTDKAIPAAQFYQKCGFSYSKNMVFFKKLYKYIVIF